MAERHRDGAREGSPMTGDAMTVADIVRLRVSQRSPEPPGIPETTDVMSSHVEMAATRASGSLVTG
jgi:hypothetical protein